MLKEYREVYQHAVSVLPDYKTLSQIELADKYAEGGPLKDAYLAAIVLRYWNIIEKLAYKDYGLYDPKEAYDWFMDALLYIIKDQPWKDPKSSVYNDPKGLEKTLNVCVKCSRANWFQASNRLKRRINHNVASLDSLAEEYKDSYLPRELTIGEDDDNSYRYIVIECFNKQQYLFALMIDLLVNDVAVDKCVDTRTLVLNIRKSIVSLPQDYYKIFAKEYQFNEQQVEKSFSYIYNMSDTKLKQTIESYVYKLRVLLKNGE